jgi:zinc protease
MSGRGIIAYIFAAAVFVAAAPASGVVALDAVKGAQVWFVENHSVPVVAMTAALPAGSVYDPSDKAGMASLAAALLEEGAGSVGPGAFRAALADHAIRLNVRPGRDYVEISLLVLPQDAEAAFRLLGAALTRPRFESDAITRQRLRAMQIIDQAKSDPTWVSWNGFHSLYFGPHPYGHPVEGDVQGLVTITREDMHAFVARHWVRGGMKIAVAGDVTAAQAKILLKKAFATLPGGSPTPPPPPGFVGAPGLHVLPLDVIQPDAIFALPGFRRGDPDYLAGTIANLILGGGENSRLGRELRVERGLTYDVSTELLTYARAGVMVGKIQAKPKAMRQALSVVRDTLRKFALGGPTAKEYADAKLYLSGSFPLAFASNEGIADQLVGLMEAGLPAGYVARHGRLIDAVSYEDVRRAARRLYASDRITLVVAGTLPPEKKSSNPYRQ